MNLTACAAGVACAAAVAVGVTGSTPDLSSANASTLTTSAQADYAAPAAQSPNCDPATTANCDPSFPASVNIYYLPPPSGDPKQDFAALQAAINNTQYDTIDGSVGGSQGGAHQVYNIDGMLEVSRTMTIRNLDINQMHNDYVVRTIYADGRGSPLTLRLENMKIVMGPTGSEASGSVSDSAGVWVTGITPEFKNLELSGGGHGQGLYIVNTTGGYITDVYVHDITWEPYPIDANDQTFWSNYKLSTLQAAGSWNAFTIHDYNGQTLATTRIVEQANGMVLNNVTSLRVVRPHVERIMTKFSDGQLYPYQSDGITVVSASNLSIQGATITHVAEGIDAPGFPASSIEITGAVVSDVPVFCFKSRGSYDQRNYSLPANSPHMTVRNSTGMRCGMAAFMAAAGSESWFQDTVAVDTGLGPDGTANPGIGNVAAYRFFQSSNLPQLDSASQPLGMHLMNPTVANPRSQYMQTAFSSENDPSDKRTQAMAKNYAIMNPTAPNVNVATNFTTVGTNAISSGDPNAQ